jgi:hypothetical protein
VKGPYHEVLTDPVSRLEAFAAMTAQERLRAGDAQLNFLLVEGQIACTHACVATRGAELSFATSRKPCSLRCAKSIMTPQSVACPDQFFPTDVSQARYQASVAMQTEPRGRRYLGGSTAGEVQVRDHSVSRDPCTNMVSCSPYRLTMEPLIAVGQHSNRE